MSELTVETQPTDVDRVLEDLSPDNVIKFAQQQRVLMLQNSELDEKMQLMVLNSIAATAINVKRITVDDANSSADRAIAASLADALKGINSNPFLVTINPSMPLTIPQAPTVPAVDLVPDETSTQLATLELSDIL